MDSRRYLSDYASGALFSRLVEGEPLGEGTMKQLRSIIREANRVPEKVRTDGGAPFRSMVFKRYLDEEGITYWERRGQRLLTLGTRYITSTYTRLFEDSWGTRLCL